MAPPPYKAWYNTARWRQLRLKVLLSQLFSCQLCGDLHDAPDLVCDHKVPHRGSEKLFWDEANLQTLCKRCHDGVKQVEEQQSLHTRGVWY